jgi:flavin reductase
MNTPEFLQLMRQHPAAVTIIATGKAPHRTGMTVSAFMSLTAEPPTVVCAINRNAFSYTPITDNQVFSVNTLSVAHVDLAMRFAGRVQVSGEERFEPAHWDMFDSGSPSLRDAVISLECRLVRQVDESTHCLMMGQVISGRCNNAAAPLLYIDGQWVTTSAPLVQVASQT